MEILFATEAGGVEAGGSSDWCATGRGGDHLSFLGGVVVELLDVEPGPVDVAVDADPLGVVVVPAPLPVVLDEVDPGGVTTVVEDDEVGGVDDEVGGVVETGGTTTVVEDDVGGVVDVVEDGGVCC